MDNLSFHLQVVDKMLPYVNELRLGISDVVGEDWPVVIERNRLHYTGFLFCFDNAECCMKSVEHFQQFIRTADGKDKLTAILEPNIYNNKGI